MIDSMKMIITIVRNLKGNPLFYLFICFRSRNIGAVLFAIESPIKSGYLFGDTTALLLLLYHLAFKKGVNHHE
jgi:hypothetical protein